MEFGIAPIVVNSELFGYLLTCFILIVIFETANFVIITDFDIEALWENCSRKVANFEFKADSWQSYLGIITIVIGASFTNYSLSCYLTVITGSTSLVEYFAFDFAVKSIDRKLDLKASVMACWLNLDHFDFIDYSESVNFDSLHSLRIEIHQLSDNRLVSDKI